MGDVIVSEDALRQLLRQAVADALEDRRDLLRDVTAEVLEDAALSEAIRQGKATDLVDRASVFAELDGSA